MRVADKWKDYELLDCGGGEKLERWDKQYLVRPDPQAIWETPRRLALALRLHRPRLLPLCRHRCPRVLRRLQRARRLHSPS